MGASLGKPASSSALQLLFPHTHVAVPEADKARVVSALQHMFPHTHIEIKEADIQKLALKKLCTRHDLSKFVGDKVASSALADLSSNTRAMLFHGKYFTRLDLVGLTPCIKV